MIVVNNDSDPFVPQDSESGDWLGFYDWLRASDGSVIGVRQRLDPEIDQFPFNLNTVGVEIDKETRVALIFFSDRRDYDPAQSLSQDFGDNYLFLGEGGSVMLTFASPPEWRSPD